MKIICKNCLTYPCWRRILATCCWMTGRNSFSADQEERDDHWWSRTVVVGWDLQDLWACVAISRGCKKLHSLTLHSPVLRGAGSAGRVLQCRWLARVELQQTLGQRAGSLCSDIKTCFVTDHHFTGPTPPDQEHRKLHSTQHDSSDPGQRWMTAQRTVDEGRSGLRRVCVARVQTVLQLSAAAVTALLSPELTWDTGLWSRSWSLRHTDMCQIFYNIIIVLTCLFNNIISTEAPIISRWNISSLSKFVNWVKQNNNSL